ncbi:hypothetical protein KY284_032719 [Solanum tuberosum]|nr:hypothetical protein KY284_032719 [Solanum tuberosum]
MGHNETYEHARGQVPMMVLLPSLNKTYSLLIERESQRNMSQTFSSSSSSELSALFTTSNISTPMHKTRSSSSYDPNAFCDYCKRTWHTQAICYQLHDYPPSYERKKKGTPNTYHGRGRSNNDKRPHPAAHNVVSESDHSPRSNNEPEYMRVVNQRAHSYGSGTRQSDHIEYHKGMNVLHEPYNQILHILGQSNL